ncbi:hypothetical protein [Sphingobacterium sp. FBM7-1]|uniref:hypothetical protein n=1 Tax=Sphingobacterium sp. FBM7-1 TaxID=2886688 RepID=UPI001D10D7CC|nr:hypothetical protein [Sphingobacterium sp. FBM7-1]MCC2600321.1 hypothetical protein [Sphingobacterium sp. FBM7-1]
MRHLTFISIFILLFIGSMPLGYGRSVVDSVLYISSAEELKNFSCQVNAGDDFSGREVRLENDIFLNDTTGWDQWEHHAAAGLEQWIPIGNRMASFKGSFDGQGHTIYGLYIHVGTEGFHQGLFGIVEDGTIKNTTIAASFIKAYHYVGALVGTIGYEKSELSNCHNTGIVIGERNHIGGIAGVSQGGTRVVGCSNTGPVTGKCDVGGIIGHYSTMGFFDGKYDGVTIYNCFNRGAVSGSQDVGGIIGVFKTISVRKTVDTLANCYNTGAIVSRLGAGGMVGYFSRHPRRKIVGYGNTLDKLTFSNCYSAGTVVDRYTLATDHLIGQYATGRIWGEVPNLAKTIEENSGPCYVKKAEIPLPKSRKLSVALYSSTEIRSPENIKDLEEAEMLSAEFVELLNGFAREHPQYKDWMPDETGINGGYPVFRE